MEEYFAALEKYNFWNGNVPELGFIRKDYTDKIFDYIHDSQKNTLKEWMNG